MAGEAPVPTADPRRKRILIADDNAYYLTIMADALVEAAYDIQALSDGFAALEILEREPGGFDVVILNRDLPGIPCMEIVKKIRDLPENEDLIVLIPAFTVSELTTAFQIGFLLYLPFVAIDLIISNILLAMGMMMVSPMTISLPFKLLLFVLLDGWARLIQGLVLTYG